MREITDPKSRTILLMEAHGRRTPWAKPEDLDFDEAVAFLTNRDLPTHLHEFRPSGGFVSQVLEINSGSGIHVVMADGTVQFLALPLPKNLAEAILTVDGNEGDLHSELDKYIRPRLDFGKCYALGVFVVLSLLPGAFLLRRRAKNK